MSKLWIRRNLPICLINFFIVTALFYRSIDKQLTLDTIYISDFYLLFMFAPFCFYGLYRDVFTTSYAVISRYRSKFVIAKERFHQILRHNLLNVVVLIVLPLLVLGLVYRQLTSKELLFILQISVRHYCLSVVYFFLFLTLFLSITEVQRNSGVLILTFFVSISSLGLIKSLISDLTRNSLNLNFLDFGIYQGHIGIKDLVIRHIVLVVIGYSIMLIRLHVLERMEFFQHERTR